MKNIDEYIEKIQELSDEFYGELGKITHSYDKDMFIADVEVQINEIPLASFEYAARDRSPMLEPYDVSEGTKCLSCRTSGNRAHIVLHSIELLSKKEPSDEQRN